jgi:hypothetical protein
VTVRRLPSVLCYLLPAICSLFLACPPDDTEAPTVKFLFPLAGDSLAAGTISIATEAHDNIEVTSVELYAGDTYLDSTGLSLTDTFRITWNAQAETVGNSYILRAVAWDRARNSCTDSTLVHFRKVIPPGALTVTTLPAGAAIWLDGANTGQTSPATVESIAPGTHAVRLTLEHYTDIDTSLEISGGQTAQLSATMYGYAVVTGTVSWAGHSLSNHCYALLDTSHDGQGAYIAMTVANPTTGEFTLSTMLSLPDSGYVLGFDDVDGNGYPNSGDGRGFWDVNGDHQMTTADMILVTPGDTVRSAQVVLYQIP